MARKQRTARLAPLRENPRGQSLVLVTLALMGLGVVMVHSALASVADPGDWYKRVDYRQTLFAILAALTVLFAWRIGYRWLNAGRRLPYAAAALLVLAIACGILVFLPQVGHAVGGKARWIRLGPRDFVIGFQPSELIRLSLVVFLAAWLSRESTDPRSFVRTFLPALGLIGACMLLVIQNDFGTAMLIGVSSAAVLFLAGVPCAPPRGGGGGGAAGFYKFVVLDPHRWSRIAALLDPWSTENPAAYQPQQSILAILNGGWFGRGAGNGIRKLGYLPEDSTDFIFSVYCEEWGFVGALLLTGLLVLWIWNARRAAAKAPDRFGMLLAGSLGFLIAMQAVLHVAVDVVVAPPTGMGFPFVSAGGTALLMMAGATSLIVAVTAQRGEEGRILIPEGSD